MQRLLQLKHHYNVTLRLECTVMLSPTRAEEEGKRVHIELGRGLDVFRACRRLSANRKQRIRCPGRVSIFQSRQQLCDADLTQALTTCNLFIPSAPS